MSIVTKILGGVSLLPLLAFASESGMDQLDFDALMDADVQLSAVMKRLQSAHETAASVYVLSGEEIVQSGVTSVPQALTLVPGVQVRRIDANTWAITARGTAGRYSSKLLVLVDGQSNYDPIHAGVNWDAINLPLYDIERIEVVRGQGGLLWGSNATNGVVNIITKHTEDTRSLVAQVETGSKINLNTSVRYGDEIGSIGSYRMYLIGKNTDSSDELMRDTSPNDDSKATGIGGRVDLNLNDDLFLMFQGRYQDQNIGTTVITPDLTDYDYVMIDNTDDRQTYSFMSQLDHYLDEETSQMARVSVASVDYESILYDEDKLKLDADYQFNTQIDTVRIDLGANYRFVDYNMESSDYVSITGDYDNLEQYGVFAQAQLELLPEELRFIVGNRSEHNTMTGWEHQPMARMLWQPQPDHSFWAAVSQGVRIPSVTETSIELLVRGVTISSLLGSSTGDTTLDNYRVKQVVLGSEDMEAETSISYELGYRYMDSDWSLDTSLFTTHAKDVLSLEYDIGPYSTEELMLAYLSNSPSFLSMLSSTEISQNLSSSAELDTYGGELVLGWQVSPRMKAEFGYSYSRYEYTLPEGTHNVIGFDSALQQWMAKVSAQVAEDHSFYSLMRYEKGEAYSVDDFFALDLSWQWQATESMKLGVTGNNLLFGSHLEYANTSELYTVPAYIEPTVVAMLKLEL